MKAVIWTGYGEAEVLQVRKWPLPQPGENEVLVRVAAAQVSAGDCEMRSLKLHFLYRLPMRLYVGVRQPQRVTVLGQDLSGVVEAVGSAVTRFKPGDAGLRCHRLSLWGVCRVRLPARRRRGHGAGAQTEPPEPCRSHLPAGGGAGGAALPAQSPPAAR